MKALFIGGTGTISTEISRLCVQKGWDLTLLNRGKSSDRVPEGARVLCADIHDEEAVRKVLGDETFDVVAAFIAFTTWITEGTPLCNPYWEYSRNKIACEDVLMRAYRNDGFPITIVRPSHTYCERSVPVALHGSKGSFQILERMRQGKKVIIPGDGATLWTMTHSRDFAVAFEGLMGNAHALGEVFHITSDESVTWNQAHETVGRALGLKPQFIHIASDTLAALNPEWVGALIGDKSNTVLFDNTKIKRAVPQFNATTRFDQGAREAVEYIYSHPECQTPDPEFDEWCDKVIEIYEKMLETMPKIG